MEWCRLWFWGHVLAYGDDTLGRVPAVSVDGQTVLGAVGWQPFGAAKTGLLS